MRLITENGITHIIVMWNLYFIKKDHIFQLCGITDYRPFAYDRVSTDKSTVAYLRVLPDDRRPVDIGGWKYIG